MHGTHITQTTINSRYVCYTETYADISPLREVGSRSAFVSIMRGCNNMCSFCIVPFTRGRERSRAMSSILNEIKILVNDDEAPLREVCLLGQNVNGYHDASSESSILYPASTYKTAAGFSNLFNSKARDLPGARFSDLLVAVSQLSPELRVRFTSPHPKDFSDDVLNEIANRPNLCKSLHLPVQSGSSSMLQRMRRGYSREAYLDLVYRARRIIPGVSISTDVISGFCGETEEEHKDTVSLMKQVKFDQAFMFSYSLREKTHAAHNLKDDIPEEVKLVRLQEVIDAFHGSIQDTNRDLEFGKLRLVLCEGPSNRSLRDDPQLTGRTDTNKRVVFPAGPLLKSLKSELLPSLLQVLEKANEFNIAKSGEIHGTKMKSAFSAFEAELNAASKDCNDIVSNSMEAAPGNYVLCRIVEANGPTLRAVAISLSSMEEYNQYNKAKEERERERKRKEMMTGLI